MMYSEFSTSLVEITLSNMATKSILSMRTLELLGLKPKDLDVYQSLLRLGTAPLRRVAEEAGLNRGTTHDVLKRLIDAGLASYVDAKKHRYFTSEDPSRLRGLATRREVAIQEARADVLLAIPELQHLAQIAHHRPSVRYYEGDTGVKDILQDVLNATENSESKTYRVYSSAGLRDLIAGAWPTYNKERLRRQVHCKAIAVGEGGETHGLDERRSIGSTSGSPTYIFIYRSKTAYVAVDAYQHLFGVVIDDEAVSETQRVIFDRLWEILPR